MDTLRGKVWLAKLTEIASRVGTGFLIALIGDRGPGKTQMGVELIRRCCETGRSARYVTAMDFFIAVKASYGDGADERERAVIQSFARPRLLVFDEVQERGETDWENRLLTHLIDLRYREERDTLLIANLLREPFIESLGPSITSRLIETGGIVECSWPSFREEQEEEI